MLLSVERDVVMMQEEAVKPPPSTASSGLRATDFSIAAIMARESPGQPTSASWPSAAASSGECLFAAVPPTAAFTGSPPPRRTFENGRHRDRPRRALRTWLLLLLHAAAAARAGAAHCLLLLLLLALTLCTDAACIPCAVLHVCRTFTPRPVSTTVFRAKVNVPARDSSSRVTCLPASARCSMPVSRCCLQILCRCAAGWPGLLKERSGNVRADSRSVNGRPLWGSDSGLSGSVGNSGNRTRGFDSAQLQSQGAVAFRPPSGCGHQSRGVGGRGRPARGRGMRETSHPLAPPMTATGL
ncbi:hypothetical protein HPB48_003631 [Haemaphysalis longicornis]|uniref:Uncharacterized protein n=1 Tax=Haemaphysalis longicornis TaxID=44386 RepID=A0A9J6FHP8_HAELO|nr:hypothetical protein HPB48_003631 [Haemaphysalis longicornis]